MRLLLVEDDVDLVTLLQHGLTRQGFEVDVAGDGKAGEKKALAQPYDVLLVDWMLPGQDGRTLIARLREAGLSTPIFMLTALSDVDRIVAGLDAGADEYLPKPFAMKELYARLRALVRRAQTNGASAELTVGPLRFDVRRRLAYLYGAPLALRDKEYLLLDLLARHEGAPVRRQAIAEQVWGAAEDVSDLTLNTTVSTLRQKLNAASPNTAPVQITTLRGIGYQLALLPRDAA